MELTVSNDFRKCTCANVPLRRSSNPSFYLAPNDVARRCRWYMRMIQGCVARAGRLFEFNQKRHDGKRTKRIERIQTDFGFCLRQCLLYLYVFSAHPPAVAIISQFFYHEDTKAQRHKDTTF
jgi:hypothetical protein